MLRHYLIIAFRSLWKNKAYSCINIAGLALGITLVLLVLLWLQDEWKYDKFHTDGKQLYRVLLTQRYDNGQVATDASTPGLLAESLKSEFPEVTHAVVVTQEEQLLFKANNTVGRETGAYASDDFFKMFSFPLLQGNPQTVLSAPGYVAISQKLAQKYFGNANPVGKTIRIDNQKEFQISGVFKNIPQNSSLHFDFLLPFKELVRFPWVHDWNAIGPRTFLKFSKEAQVGKVDAKIRNYLKKRLTEYTATLSLQAYEDMYLYSHFKNGIQDGGRIQYVKLLAVTALFVLLIACINFTNLTTAGAITRFREIGVRKINGASRSMIAGQFIFEAVLSVVLACGCGLLLATLLLPVFNQITGKAIHIPYADGWFVVFLVGLLAITACFSGSYPAFFLSSVKPVTILKGTLRFKPGAALFRKGLIVFQFTLSGLLIVGTLVVYQQMEYIQTKNLGFDRENLIYKEMDGPLTRNFTPFKNELSQSTAIQSISLSNQSPLAVNFIITSVDWAGKKPDHKIAFSYLGVNYDFVKTMNLTMKEGRDFSPDFVTDSVNVIINEEAARRMGLSKADGRDITLFSDITLVRDIVAKGKIIGVVKDFHLKLLHSSIEPLVIFLDHKPEFGYVLIKTAPGKTRQALSDFERLHKKYNPGFPFSYEFADATYHKFYKSEILVKTLANYFVVLAILISCLGLLGMTLFTTTERTKEIGIRKVLGASVRQIVALLTKDFVKLVLLANIIAWPLAYYVMNEWLQNYAYRIEIAWWIFALAGASALLVALLTVSFQAIKAARANPVKSLRNE